MAGNLATVEVEKQAGGSGHGAGVAGRGGSRVVSRVEVGYTQLGTLTTEEQKLLYVLIKLWEDDGKPDVQVYFSTRGLARMLKKKGWGTNVIDSVTKSLR